MHFSTALEQGTTGRWYGRFIDFPGTIARALTRESLLEELRKEIVYHFAWLQKHGEKVPAFDTVVLTISEEVTSVCELGESGGEVALFAFDEQAVTKEKLDYLCRLMGYSRRDLLQLTGTIPQETLAYVPSGKSRTITDILHHICNAEEFYVSRLGKEADSQYEGHAGMPTQQIDVLPLFERLKTVREACIKTLEDTILQKGGSTFTRSEYTNYPQEKWTAHKVLRRFLEHEREHYYNILEYLNRPIRTP